MGVGVSPRRLEAPRSCTQTPSSPSYCMRPSNCPQSKNCPRTCNWPSWCRAARARSPKRRCCPGRPPSAARWVAGRGRGRGRSWPCRWVRPHRLGFDPRHLHGWLHLCVHRGGGGPTGLLLGGRGSPAGAWLEAGVLPAHGLGAGVDKLDKAGAGASAVGAVGRVAVNVAVKRHPGRVGADCGDLARRGDELRGQARRGAATSVQRPAAVQRARGICG